MTTKNNKKERRVYRHWEKKLDKRIFIENISKYHIWFYVEISGKYYAYFEDSCAFERENFLIKDKPRNIFEQVIIDKLNAYLQKNRLKLMFEEMRVDDFI